MVSTNSTSRSFTPHGVGVSVVVLIGTAQHRCGPWKDPIIFQLVNHDKGAAQ